ncbi:5'-methylthioadenosine/S-adenosylhomocysteine nucleosidase [Longispora albida]|uniref:5'-methylthioadenosine/S-adenosylhomocysteine nucleosidase family protein n=1 Tax=Longispora albida TaxID=203523 RepID=UPI0003716326|nr:5'-methylthioadenosine/S-adenosylhomocysteine nucleosidase [Longispora albida]
MNEPTVAVLTALELEYQAVRDRLSGVRAHLHRAGTRFEVGRTTAGTRIALALAGKGNNSAAVLAERAITEFGPSALLFTGVAGALYSDVKLGSLVVATHIYGYHGGTSQDDGFMARPRAWEAPHGALQLAQHVRRTGAWDFEVHFGAIAAGEAVVNSTRSVEAVRLRKHYNDAMAVEMEGAGVAQACHLNRSLPVMVIRGLSDRADGNKLAADSEGWQPVAARNAASFGLALADELAADEKNSPVRSTVMNTQPGNSNYAGTNTGIMMAGGTVHGNINVGAPGPVPARSFAEELDSFRTRLTQARVTGEVDEDTYTAAEAELSVISDSLAAGEPASGGRIRLALKKLRGLVEEVTGLAAAVAAILTLTAGGR